MKKLLPTLLPLLALSVIARADGNIPSSIPGSTPVYIVASQATTNCVHAAAAANAQATATLPSCGAGQYAYITLIESTYSAIAAPSATLMATTTTNFTTSMGFSQPMQAAVGESSRILYFNPPLKTQSAATPTTVVGNAGVASISENMKICGFCAL